MSKKLHWVLVLCLVLSPVVLISCSGDDEGGDEKACPELAEGTWEMVSVVTYSECADEAQKGDVEKENAEITQSDCEVTFNPDHGSSASEDMDADGNVKIEYDINDRGTEMKIISRLDFSDDGQSLEGEGDWWKTDPGQATCKIETKIAGKVK